VGLGRGEEPDALEGMLLAGAPEPAENIAGDLPNDVILDDAVSGLATSLEPDDPHTPLVSSGELLAISRRHGSGKLTADCGPLTALT